MTKRVAILDMGGLAQTATTCWALCELLRERGYEVSLYGPFPDEAVAQATARGLTVVNSRLRRQTGVPGKRQARHLVPALWVETGLAAARGRHDIIIGFCYHGLIAGTLAKLFRPGALLVGYFQDLYPWFERPWKITRRLARYLSRYLDIAVDVEEHRGAIRQALYALRCSRHTVANALAERPEVAPRQELESGRLRLVYAGYIGPATGFPQLLEAVSDCADVAELVLMGNGAEDYVDHLSRSPNVRYLGWVAQDEAIRQISQAQVGVSLYPFRRPGLTLNTLFAGSQKIAFYIACGLPVLAADGPSMDFVTQEGLGLRVPAESPGPIAEAIRRLAAQPELRQQMTARAAAIFRTKYNYRV